MDVAPKGRLELRTSADRFLPGTTLPSAVRWSSAVVGDLLVENFHGPAESRHPLLQGGTALEKEGDPVLRRMLSAQNGDEPPQVRDAEAGIAEARDRDTCERVGQVWLRAELRAPDAPGLRADEDSGGAESRQLRVWWTGPQLP